MSYLVKLSGNVKDKDDPRGPTVDGEYGGSRATLEEATSEAHQFARHTVGGRISVYRVKKDGKISWVKDIRS